MSEPFWRSMVRSRYRTMRRQCGPPLLAINAITITIERAGLMIHAIMRRAFCRRYRGSFRSRGKSFEKLRISCTCRRRFSRVCGIPRLCQINVYECTFWEKRWAFGSAQRSRTSKQLRDRWSSSEHDVLFFDKDKIVYLNAPYIACIKECACKRKNDRERENDIRLMEEDEARQRGKRTRGILRAYLKTVSTMNLGRLSEVSSKFLRIKLNR